MLILSSRENRSSTLLCWEGEKKKKQILREKHLLKQLNQLKSHLYWMLLWFLLTTEEKGLI